MIPILQRRKGRLKRGKLPAQRHRWHCNSAEIWTQICRLQSLCTSSEAIFPALADLPDHFSPSVSFYLRVLLFPLTLFKLIYANWRRSGKYRTLERKKIRWFFLPILYIISSPKLCLWTVMLTLVTALPSSDKVPIECFQVPQELRRIFKISRSLLRKSHLCVYV